jgi:hypothetical protein
VNRGEEKRREEDLSIFESKSEDRGAVRRSRVRRRDEWNVCGPRWK